MPQDKEVKNLIINQLTKEEYNNLTTKSDEELYIITDDAHLTSNEIELLLNGKANIDESGYELVYAGNTLSLNDINGNVLSNVTIKSAPDVDNKTINYNDLQELQNVGELTLDGTFKNVWIGTTAEYEAGIASGLITANTECIITDDENETITTADFNIPTKLSELANDSNFVKQDALKKLENEVDTKLDLKAEDSNVVHKSGTETVNGIKTFTQNITVGNNATVAKIGHKNSSFIEFNQNILKYSSVVNNETKENDILHSGNLIAGANVTIKKIDGNYIISSTGGGGGGGGTGSGDGGSATPTFTLTSISDDYIYTAFGEPVSLRYIYTSEQNESATVQYYVNSELKATARLTTNGQVTYDFTSFLVEGYNTVQIKVTDIYGGTRSLNYTVNTVSLKITSNFDSSIAYFAPIDFRYTPVGEISKTIHFEIDGDETTETVTASGRQQSKIINLTHGVHTLKVWATAIIEDVEITSNTLYYEIIYATENGTLISSEFTQTEFKQGDTVNISYNVYNLDTLTCPVQFYVNDELVSDLQVDRKRQIWSKTINEFGVITIRIQSNDASREFVLNFEEVEINVEPVTDYLQLYLTANGRSNNDLNRNEWKYEDIECTLTGFNWVNNGWIDNKLKIGGGARVEIPFKIFASDFRTTGKTIEFEFETSNVADYDSVLIDCKEESTGRGFRVDVQRASLKSEQSEVNVKFKEEERVRLSFVIESRSSYRLIYTYLNGILSGLTQYPDDDDFSQVTPLNISIGSDTCDIDIYNIRVYNTYLTENDILDNYIADTFNINEKLSLYNRNDVYDSYGKIVYNKLIKQLPIMVITGDLPSVKGDKKKVTVKYEDSMDATRNFEMSDVTLDIQGTSSQYYPKKNYKISKMPESYQLRSSSIPETAFTLKADYMESSHAHNTGLAKFINQIYTTKTPPQVTNENIRTTIDGFPIAMFYRPNSSTTMEYFGIYNFNNDKGNNDTFGFIDGCESWEFTNNTSDRCLFKSDDFTDPSAVLTDFEARYPDGYTNTAQLERVVRWVVRCDNDSDGVNKFKSEIDSYFNKDFLLTYYIISELFGMVDSRAKNMFLNTYGDGIWYPVFYDLDTCIGLNNEGVNNFNFDIEYHDTIGTEGVWNGEKSALWNLVEQAYETEIQELYNSYRNSGALSYEKVMEYLYGEQIAKICEAQYNEDANFKYLSPLIDENIATYLYTAQGSRLNHIKWWLYNRFKYIDSKYIASDFQSNYLTLRLYTPDTWQDIEPNAEITVTPYIDQYVHIKYGAYNVRSRAKHDEPTTIVPPDIKFNDTETIVYGADKITSIGSLAPLYAGTIDVSKAVKLSELIIGAGGNYSNTNLKSLTLGNNTLLSKLDIRNCPSLTGALDVSGCTNIRELQAEGTTLTSVKLAEAGAINILRLPDTITNLTIKNQNNITDFTCGNLMTTLVIENSNLDALSILNNSNPNKVRITGIDWTLEDFSILDRVYALTGVDENGYNTEHGIIAGTVRMSNVKESIVNEYKKKFVGINFIVDPYASEDAVRTDDGYIITTNNGEVLLMTNI